VFTKSLPKNGSICHSIIYNNSILKMGNILHDHYCSQPFIINATIIGQFCPITLPKGDGCLILGLKIKMKHLQLQRPWYSDFGRKQPFQIFIIVLLSMELTKTESSKPIKYRPTHFQNCVLYYTAHIIRFDFRLFQM
jgi:hypothetical protein